MQPIPGSEERLQHLQPPIIRPSLTSFTTPNLEDESLEWGDASHEHLESPGKEEKRSIPGLPHGPPPLPRNPSQEVVIPPGSSPEFDSAFLVPAASPITNRSVDNWKKSLEGRQLPASEPSKSGSDKENIDPEKPEKPKNPAKPKKPKEPAKPKKPKKSAKPQKPKSPERPPGLLAPGKRSPRRSSRPPKSSKRRIRPRSPSKGCQTPQRMLRDFQDGSPLRLPKPQRRSPRQSARPPLQHQMSFSRTPLPHIRREPSLRSLPSPIGKPQARRSQTYPLTPEARPRSRGSGVKRSRSTLDLDTDMSLEEVTALEILRRSKSLDWAHLQDEKAYHSQDDDSLDEEDFIEPNPRTCALKVQDSHGNPKLISWASEMSMYDGQSPHSPARSTRSRLNLGDVLDQIPPIRRISTLQLQEILDQVTDDEETGEVRKKIQQSPLIQIKDDPIGVGIGKINGMPTPKTTFSKSFQPPVDFRSGSPVSKRLSIQSPEFVPGSSGHKTESLKDVIARQKAAGSNNPPPKVQIPISKLNKLTLKNSKPDNNRTSRGQRSEKKKQIIFDHSISWAKNLGRSPVGSTNSGPFSNGSTRPVPTTSSPQPHSESGKFKTSKPKEPVFDMNNLIINYLPPDWTSHALRNLFKSYGVLQSCKVVMDHQTGLSKGYGFVKFQNYEQAEKAIEALNEFKVGNKTLKVAHSRVIEGSLHNKLYGDERRRGSSDSRASLVSTARKTSKSQRNSGERDQPVLKPKAFRSGSNKSNKSNKSLDSSGSPKPRIEIKTQVLATNLYIANLDKSITSSDLQRHFSICGYIVQCRVLLDSHGSSRGIGFVRYDNHESALRAIDEFDGRTLEGTSTVIQVRFANTPRLGPSEPKDEPPR